MRAKMFVVALAVVSTACGVSQQQEIEIGQQNVQQINQQGFGITDPAKYKVTCFTCHRGSQHPETQVPPPPVPPLPPRGA